ncbi:MAG TPA: hypothetical protein VNO50_05310 [Pyrinomonadaceae bacterium]|nr:hypothetical protein [Pyrinomonadaceae bacterium]
MAIRPRGRKRSLSKKVSSFNMWMDQVYQVRAIMEATGAVKDAPVIRELLDEASGARRRKALGITDSEEPPGQGTAETLHTLQTLLLRLIKHEDLLLRNQRVGFKLLLETFVEARTGRALAWEELIERPLIQKGRTKQDLANYFDMKTRYVKEYVDSVVEKIKRELDAEGHK